MLLYWIWLTTRKRLGPRSVMKALAHFSSPEEAFYAQKSEYLLAGLTEREAEALADKDLDRPHEIMDACGENEIRILTYQDAAYSNRLRNIPDPPAVLYYKGNLPALDDEPLVAVIGSRKSSLCGLTVAKRMGFQIGACGGIVVSGMASGGDAMAMAGALSSYRPVIGVLGNGVDIPYPACNRNLYQDLIVRGCVVSEYPPGTQPTRYSFPARNRIISGLSLGVVVVEAPARSGTLITADYALEQGRDLFAVPGSVNAPACAGSNRLLKEGAILVESGWDVMCEYQALYPDRIREVRAGEAITLSPAEQKDHLPPIQRKRDIKRLSDKKCIDIPEKQVYIDLQDVSGLSEDERRILSALQGGPLVADDLISACGGAAGRTLSSLTLLEIRKYVTRLPGNRYELGPALLRKGASDT